MQQEANVTPQKQENPKVFITSISFNDGTTLPLNHNSIVAFTGANNSGKSQVLKDIEHWFDSDWNITPIVITSIAEEFIGTMSDNFLNARFYINRYGRLYIYESTNFAYTKDDVKSWWSSKLLPQNLHRLFIKLIDTEQRLQTSKALQRTESPERYPIFKLYKNEVLSQVVSDYFKQAFGEDLIVNRNELFEIPLHVGDAPDKEAYNIANQDLYYAKVAKLPRIDDQGDGMRSYASILLDTFTSEYTLTLIDEPEAFLHPPQARLLGKMLAKNNPNERQLFISTHSEDFLQGLLDADNENVTIIRINRQDDRNHMSILQNSEIKRLWSNPLLRYSNILSGLFHEKVVVCESDYDCLFYQAIMDATYESEGEIAPDILFTHCGGKGRMKDAVSALKAVGVSVVAIPDFDVINKSDVFRPLTEAFGINWDNQLAGPMKTIWDWLNANQTKKEEIKCNGKFILGGNAYPEYEAVENVCKRCGLYVVPCGEIECFDKTINKQKREWVYVVLERGGLDYEPHLEEARKFVQSIIDFK
jgi:hypothetical protein